MLKPSEQNNADPKINKALDYYASHTAQIEVYVEIITLKSNILNIFILDCEAR